MKALLQYPNVVGFGTGYKITGGKKKDQLCMSVLVSKKLPKIALKPEDIIPSKLGISGVMMTDVIEVGTIRALKERTDEWRPAPPGTSIGHFAITAGTFGCVVYKGKKRFILSNNHVLANQNDASPGDAIFQPGVYDGGDEIIASLEDFVPIVFDEGGLPTCPLAVGVADIINVIPEVLGSSHRLKAVREIQQAPNLVDAAIARPLSDSLIKDEVLEIGHINGSAATGLGDAVKKSGRTTGVTEGIITTVRATVKVQYSGAVATLEDQIISTYMSDPGDSGSVLLNDDNEAVGLLFAGSDQVTIYNTIFNVLDLLGVTI